MADDLKQTGKPDDTRINVEQEHELGYWSACRASSYAKRSKQPGLWSRMCSAT